MKKRIKLLVFLVATILVLTTTYSVFFKGALSFSGQENVTNLTLNGQLINPSEIQKLKPGKYKLSSAGPLIAGKTQDLTIKPFSETKIDLSQKILSSDEIAQLIAMRANYSLTKVTRSYLLENNTWLVFTLADPKGQREASDYICNFRGRGWQVVESGTGFSYYGLRESDLPKSVIDVFGGSD